MQDIPQEQQLVRASSDLAVPQQSPPPVTSTGSDHLQASTPCQPGPRPPVPSSRSGTPDRSEGSGTTPRSLLGGHRNPLELTPRSRSRQPSTMEVSPTKRGHPSSPIVTEPDSDDEPPRKDPRGQPTSFTPQPRDDLPTSADAPMAAKVLTGAAEQTTGHPEVQMLLAQARESFAAEARN